MNISKKNSVRYLIQNWRYLYVSQISLRKQANKQTDRHTRNLKIFETSVGTSQEYFPRNFWTISHLELKISLYLYNFNKEVSQLTDWQTYKKSELLGTSEPTSQECLQKISKRYLIQNWRYPYSSLNSVRK